MTILVSDTSVLIDLERGELISCAFKLSATFAVPDVLYERELRDYGDEELVKLGLRVESLDGDGVALATRHMQAQWHLTVPDSFALALAKRNGWTLLTGDGPLRELAKAEGVDCHGVLWLLDEFESQDAATYVQLTQVLKESPFICVAGYPRERLRFVLAGTLNALDRAIFRLN
jgi:predicted nucleic acid-binding protein